MTTTNPATPTTFNNKLGLIFERIVDVPPHLVRRLDRA